MPESPDHALIASKLQEHLDVTAALRDHIQPIAAAAEQIRATLQRGGKILLCGNGGSAADAQHIAAELVGRFETQRKGLPAIALTTDSSILTSVGNDYGFEHIFSRQVESFAQAGDLLIGISTSGRSGNVLRAVEAASTLGCKTIGLLGGTGGDLAQRVDIGIIVPSPNTARVQECHILIGHIWCNLVDSAFSAA